MHGCRLLRVGGKIVYSTCSLNPIEARPRPPLRSAPLRCRRPPQAGSHAQFRLPSRLLPPPAQNEAVVAEVLRQSQGAMVLEDVGPLHPQLRRLPGLKTWQVWDKNGHHPEYGQAEEANRQILRSMYPDAVREHPGSHPPPTPPPLLCCAPL